ncbi:MAG: MBL fold metallo-hydrolase [Clostridia bacterium]|nr:MBL fold metallo-hydrolase [Clostridia bacterium]
MFEIKSIKNNTWYFESFSNVGIYTPDGKNAVLIDSCDHPRMVKSLDRQLSEMGLTVSAVINTHCHVDHICGNRYFQEKYGCRLLSTEKEKPFIRYPDLESELYYAGVDIKKESSPFFLAEPSETEIIWENNLPDGIKIVPLPGHGFEMIGVITADNVFFLADSVLSKKTWDQYRLPFFHDVNSTIETLEKIKTVKADIYVPSHDAPTDSIEDLAQYNIDRLKEKKELVLSLCEGRNVDSIYTEYVKKENIKLRASQYPMFAVMIKNLLQSLVEDGKIHAEYDNYRLVYELK